MNKQNEHVLDFHEGVEHLPEWLGVGLSMIMGAGDLDQGGELNVKTFSEFDVFFCNAWDNNGSFQKNIDYLSNQYYHKKVICVINVDNVDEMRSFTSLFAHRFRYIDGYAQHTPHMNITDLEKILEEGGSVVNIYEKSENCVKYDDIITWLRHDSYPYPGILDGRIYKDLGITGGLSEDQSAHVKGLMLPIIRDRLSRSITLSLSNEITENLDSCPVSDLQKILRGLLYEVTMPLNMRGELKFNIRPWRNHGFIELVVSRVKFDLRKHIIAEFSDESRSSLENLINYIEEDIQSSNVFPSRMKYLRFKKLLKSSGASL
jgi:hypothetical protein